MLSFLKWECPRIKPDTYDAIKCDRYGLNDQKTQSQDWLILLVKSRNIRRGNRNALIPLLFHKTCSIISQLCFVLFFLFFSSQNWLLIFLCWNRVHFSRHTWNVNSIINIWLFLSTINNPFPLWIFKTGFY